MDKIKCLFKHKYKLCDFIEAKHWVWNIYYCERCRKIKLLENPIDNYGKSCLQHFKKNNN